MDRPLDATLLAAADGDDAAWRQLIEAYSGRVYGVVYRQCGDGDLAEEITQATFVKVVDKLASYQELGRFEAWLFRIAMNRLRDEMRRRKRQAVPIDLSTVPDATPAGHRAAPGPDAALLDAERGERLWQAVSELPAADQELIALRYSAGLDYPRIAEVLSQPLGTVLARGHRALKKLRARLGESE